MHSQILQICVPFKSCEIFNDQLPATHCNTVQHTATHTAARTKSSDQELQKNVFTHFRAATHCNTVLHTATHTAANSKSWDQDSQKKLIHALTNWVTHTITVTHTQKNRHTRSHGLPPKVRQEVFGTQICRARSQRTTRSLTQELIHSRAASHCNTVLQCCTLQHILPHTQSHGVTKVTE